MDKKTFSLTLPADLCDALDKEAVTTFRKQNARTQMVLRILADRYQLKELNTGQPHGPRNSTPQANQQIDVN